MGCDIHLYSETKKDGQWVADKADTFKVSEEDGTELGTSYKNGRNYWLFGLLCNGVRTDWPWSFEGRGLPEDCSTEIKAISDAWDGDGHSHSWLTVAELKEKAMELLVQTSSDAQELCGYLQKLIKGLPESDPDNQRIVFFFDN